MNQNRRIGIGILAGLIAMAALPACQTLREVARLREVDFSIDRVTEAALVGIPLERLQAYQDLGASDLLRVTTALSRRELPFSFRLHLLARNPEENAAQARLVEMDWTLFIDETETVSGVFNENLVLPPGTATDVPITVSLDLVEFFDRSARDLVELALAVAGQGDRPKDIRLQIVPTIDTPLGPIRYPEPITVVSEEVGASPRP